ncbi:MAG: LLM class flavin-dependent oxidoreductase [Streptosporangiaceae bacterium]
MSESLLDRIGVFLFPWGKTPPTIESLTDMACTIEELGFDSVQIPWHYTLPTSRIFPAFENRFCLDPTVVLPIIAHETSRVRIGFNSAVLPTAHPYHWAKWFASMDVITGGRFIGGVALGWWGEDFTASGTDMKGRARRFDEGLDILADLLAGRPITEAGEFYDARGLDVAPLPVQRPLPLWLGGGIKSVERAARYTSALCPINPSVAEVRDELRPALDAAFGRYGKKAELANFTYAVIEDDEEILREYHLPRMRSRLNDMPLGEAMGGTSEKIKLEPIGRVLWGSPDACAAQMRDLIGAGVDYFVLDFHYHGLEPEEFGKSQMRRFVDEVVPLV